MLTLSPSQALQAIGPLFLAFLAYFKRNQKLLGPGALILYILTSCATFLTFALNQQFDFVVIKEVVFRVMFLIAINDVVQYVCGKGLGQWKLAKNISPNKTWEGAIAGVLTCTILGELTSLIMNEPGYEWAIYAFLVASFGILGDLLISAYKRQSGLQTTGHSLPGMGGLLDRIDSFLLGAPIFTIAYTILH